LVGRSQEAAVTIEASAEAVRVLASRPDLTDLFMVGEVSLKEGGGGVLVQIARAAGDKCPRCWNVRTDVGVDPAHPDVCGRCAAVLERL
jgi:isoleucyl-tRNA synthetase